MKTYRDIFLCKYWRTFVFEFFSKIPEKIYRDVFSDEQVSFTIDQNFADF